MRTARRTSILAGALLTVLACLAVAPPPAVTLYQSVFVVTGTGDENRQYGFAQALQQLLAKVSGDRRLAANPAVADMMSNAAAFVTGHDYLDLKVGKPIHDEQGSYDRPHYLTVDFDRAKIDAALATLGRKPWLDRPRLVVFLGVHRDPKTYVVNSDDDRDDAMRQSFDNASARFAVPIVFPDHATVTATLPSFDAAAAARVADLNGVAKTVGGDQALLGTLVWSDPDQGWIADWQVDYRGRPYHWQLKGISFDDAFRDALSGAAQALSGNGEPD